MARGLSLVDLLGGASVLVGVVGGIYWLAQNVGSKGTSMCSAEAVRQRVVQAANGEVGQKRLEVYFADAAPQYVGRHAEWCGIFALWALHQAGLARSVQWKTGLGFVEVEHADGPEGRDFPRTTNPQPGDVAYYSEPYQHHAVVARVHGDQVDLINGNGSGGVVSLSTGPLAKATAYYSIQKYVDAYVAKGCPA